MKERERERETAVICKVGFVLYILLFDLEVLWG